MDETIFGQHQSANQRSESTQSRKKETLIDVFFFWDFDISFDKNLYFFHIYKSSAIHPLLLITADNHINGSRNNKNCGDNNGNFYENYKKITKSIQKPLLLSKYL